MTSSQDTTKHTCCHCQIEVLTGKGCTPAPADKDTEFALSPFEGDEEYEDFKPDTKWIVPLKHDPDAVKEAALSGCPFFVLLWEKLEYCTPEELRETKFFFKLKGEKLEHTPVIDYESRDNLLVPSFGHPGQELYEITKCKIMAITKGVLWQVESFDVVSDWDDPSANHAIARLVEGHTSSKQAMGQIRRQLQYCLSHHNKCKAASGGIRPCRFILVGESTNRTVKVIRAQYLDNGDAEPYAALSYCWGHDQVFKLMSANKAQAEGGILLNSLPKTITDAIFVTRELGIKLLWVDSLCLVQDEEDELAKEVAKMHHYYGNARITISAAEAASCSEGFLQDDPIPPKRVYGEYSPIYFPVDLENSDEPSTLRFDHVDMNWAAIESRAWTLQEGLLSRRLVSFTPRTVRWSCRTALYGKDFNDDLQRLHESLSAVCSGTEALSDQQLSWKKFQVWGHVVNHYSTRVMSNTGDRLPAISGISSVLSAGPDEMPERGDQLGFMAGFLVYHSLANPLRLSAVDTSKLEIKFHPQDNFESGILALQLLWNVRLSRSDRQDTQSLPYVAPSWSWAHYEGSTFTDIPYMDNIWFNTFCLTAWEQGMRVREVCVIPRNSEAPFGALNGGSITLDGLIFRPHDEVDKIGQILFDDDTHVIFCPDEEHDKIKEITLGDEEYVTHPYDCSGFLCFQIIPNANLPEIHLKSPEGGMVGIVLEPVELGGHFRSGGIVYRRVGVYYNPEPPVKNVQGKVETITII